MASQQILAEEIMRERLAENYLRIDDCPATVPGFALDVATVRAQQEIKALAAFSVNRFVQHPRLAAILAHRAPARDFTPPLTLAQEA